MNTSANLSDKGRNTEASSLRSGSPPITGRETKPQKTRGLYYAPTKADPSRGTWDTAGSITLNLTVRAAPGLQGLKSSVYVF